MRCGCLAILTCYFWVVGQSVRYSFKFLSHISNFERFWFPRLLIQHTHHDAGLWILDLPVDRFCRVIVKIKINLAERNWPKQCTVLPLPEWEICLRPRCVAFWPLGAIFCNLERHHLVWSWHKECDPFPIYLFLEATSAAKKERRESWRQMATASMPSPFW